MFKKSLSRFFGILSAQSLAFSRKLNPPMIAKPSIREERATPWFKIDGDKTLRLEYDYLNNRSVVFDVGGYEGQWASDIYAKYNPTVFVFEPVHQYANSIYRRFKKNLNIHAVAAGLSGSTRTEYISLSDDQSSTLKTSEKRQSIDLLSVTEFMKKNKIKFIDLMKINIEGGEYELLEHLIETGAIKAIKDLQVQFHDFDFIDNAEQRMKKIQKKLAKTHRLTYQYPFIWENWRLKPGKRKTYE